VIYEKWFNRKDFRNTLKDFPTIFGTIMSISRHVLTLNNIG
jgi:hypothetical protein